MQQQIFYLVVQLHITQDESNVSLFAIAGTTDNASVNFSQKLVGELHHVKGRLSYLRMHLGTHVSLFIMLRLFQTYKVGCSIDKVIVSEMPLWHG